MAAANGDNAAAGRWIQIQVASPAGDKHPLKVRTSDDVGTLRAVVTQMWDSGDWTQVNDRREDRKEYSDFLDEDTGFAEVVALQGNPQSQTQGFMDRFSGKPRSWLEWQDKRGKLRLMCGVYIMEDGKTLAYYHVDEGSVVHPLYERYGDTLDASAAMLVDPTWYKEQYNQAKKLANEMSSYDWQAAQSRAIEQAAQAQARYLHWHNLKLPARSGCQCLSTRAPALTWRMLRHTPHHGPCPALTRRAVLPAPRSISRRGPPPRPGPPPPRGQSAMYLLRVRVAEQPVRPDMGRGGVVLPGPALAAWT